MPSHCMSSSPAHILLIVKYVVPKSGSVYAPFTGLNSIPSNHGETSHAIPFPF
jgi:hypothetical protein